MTSTADRLEPKREAYSEMSDEYRATARRIAEFQTLAELVGVLPYAEWVDRVPDYQRKQMLIAKIQDEVGHGHVTARVAEDLGGSREQVLIDFAEGRSKLLNIFHYRIESWEAVGPAAILQNSAAIVQFQSLKQGTYLPYARALKKIEKEESFHYHHAMDLIHEIMTNGTEEQRHLAQESFETWFPRLLAYFGPPDSDRIEDNPAWQMGLKVDSNDELRQRWVDRILPAVQDLGIKIDPELAWYDEDEEHWRFPETEWDEVKTVLKEGGPAYRDWVEHVRASLDRNELYRGAALRAAA